VEGSELLEVRKQKRDRLIELGIDPYGEKYVTDVHAQEIKDEFESLDGKRVSVAGRIMAIRGHGKVAFMDLQDQTGRVQIYVREDEVGEQAYAVFKLLDIGDIIGVKGQVFKTRRGEVSVNAEDIKVLTKALRPLPEKWHGLKDVDLRYRRRYVDLIVNERVRETFILRSKMVSSMRRFLDERGFLEVETPILGPIAGGATARPFRTHHNALDMDLYLRIATELHLKRCIVGGLEKVYEIGKNFRNEGISTKHNPEFTSVEIYEAYADYEDMMKLTEDMLSTIAEEVLGTTTITYQGREINLRPPWERVRLTDAIKKYAGIDIEALETDEDAARVADELGLKMDKKPTVGSVIDELLGEKVEPNLVQPIFLFDYPVVISPLAKKIKERPKFTYRFEAFINGMEIANAFSELNDPYDQRERFEAQVKNREKGDEEAHVMDHDFIMALEYGMPPTGGIGIGIDRLVMLFTDSPSIRDVILFPLMRPQASHD